MDENVNKTENKVKKEKEENKQEVVGIGAAMVRRMIEAYENRR